MCKESPGPRCSNHAKITMDRAANALTEARNQYPTGSLEVKIAERDYHEALDSFLSTPDGLAQIANESPELVRKYQKTRDYQVEALNEIRSGRFSKMASLLTSSQSFFEQEEIDTVLASVRKISEKSHVKQLGDATISLTEQSEEEKKHHYLSLLNYYENRLREAQRGILTNSQMETLTALRQQKPPKEITTLETYGKAFAGLVKSREAMRKEIQRIAVLQDVSPKIAGAYHDAYRKEYQTEYAHLPVKQQPNPPREWVEGRYETTGFQNDSSTMLAPSDAATMYATYRLRSDMQAIPDYLKNSRNTASVSMEDNNVNIILCNSKGKEIENSHIQVSDIHTAAEKLQGRIIVMGNDSETRNWLTSLSKKASLRSSVLPTSDLSSKHFNLPDNSMNTLCQAVNVEGGGTQAENTMKAYLAARMKIASKWNSKAPRRYASPLEELPLESRWA